MKDPACGNIPNTACDANFNSPIFISSKSLFWHNSKDSKRSLNNDELKDARTAILGDYINSSFHIRRITKYANAIINQLMNNKDYKVKKTKVEIY